MFFLVLLVNLIAFDLENRESPMPAGNKELAENIMSDKSLEQVYNRAVILIKSGFNAGTGYRKVWIRDFNTFINLSCDLLPREAVVDNLLTFFKFQGADGNIPDGFVPLDEKTGVGYDYIFSESAPGLAAHKNTVETDQESSLVQAI